MEHVKNFYKNKKTLVTGGAGFIGSHLSEKLCSCEADVTVLDDLSFGFVSNLKNCLHKEGPYGPSENKINFVAGNITDIDTCLRATKEQEIVFHLAAMTSVPESIKNPQELLETYLENIILMVILLFMIQWLEWLKIFHFDIL